MKKSLAVLIAIFVLVTAHQAFGAIAFDAASSVTTASNATSVTISHTVGGGLNRILFVFALTTNNAATTTYNGVQMTQIGTQLEANDSRWLTLFYLPNPASGAHNIVITTATSSLLLRGMGSSYTGASGVIDGSSTKHDDSTITQLTTNVTTTLNNDWAVLVSRQTGGLNPGGIQPGASTTFRSSDTFDVIADTNQAISPAGAAAMTVTASSTGNGGFYTSMAAFGPAYTTTSDAIFFSGN